MADKSPDSSSDCSSSMDKTRSVIEDAFRRADKNDDGSLSLEEFQTYFADESVSISQLNEIFTTIDTHKTNNIDIGELCALLSEYFSKFWTSFDKLFSNIDDISHAVTDTIHMTAKHYNDKSFIEQFATRYLLREALNHIHAVERPLDHVNNSLEERAAHERPAVESSPVITEVTKSTTVPRWQLKLERRFSEHQKRLDSDTAMSSDSLNEEVSRLSKLVDQLERKVVFTVVVDEEEITSMNDNLMFLVSYDIISTDSDVLLDIEGYIKQYVNSVKTQAGCMHVMVRKYIEKHRFIVYEVWENAEMFKSHDDSVVRKTFKDACSKHIKKINQFELPESCWSSV